MKKKFFCPAAAFFFLFMIAAVACSQEHISFKRLGINEGLSQNSVFCMLQDHNGFIWIGTEDGLNKYDGYEFTIYKHRIKDKNSLSHSQVNALQEDRGHNIWIGTSAGLTIFSTEKEKFTQFKIPEDSTDETADYISTLAQDPAGNIWIGSNGGLTGFDTRSGRFSHYSRPRTRSGNSLDKVKALFVDNRQALWVSIGNDLRRFDLTTHQFLPLPAKLEQNSELRQSNVRVIRQDRDGTYWFGTETAGLFEYDPGKDLCMHYTAGSTGLSGLPASVVRDILCTGTGQIWVGTRGGLSIFDRKTGLFSNYTSNRYNLLSLSFNSVRSFLKDKTGNIWIGTFAGGINICTPGSANFTNISEQIGQEKGLTHSVVSAILPNRDGSLWIGTEGGGLNYANPQKGVFRHYALQKSHEAGQNNIIKSLARDTDSSLWVGAYEGLRHFDAAKGTFTAFSLNKESEAREKRQEITSLLVEPAGVWAGSNGSGLYFLDRRFQVRAYLHQAGNPFSISSDNVLALLENGPRNLWVGTQRGLNHFDRATGRFMRYLNQPENDKSLSNNTVVSLFNDSRNHFWIGTLGGLNYFDPQTGNFYAITEDNGLPNNVINAIEQDDDGNLWVSTNRGLCAIRFKRFEVPFRSGDIEILHYTQTDGLQSNQFSARAAAINQGQLFFGGINGISSFYPGSIIRNRNKPSLVFTGLEIKNKPITLYPEKSSLQRSINETGHITLRYDEAFITLKFAALDYVNPGKNQYAYKLEGLRNDNDWHYVGNLRAATYTSLGAGNYIFKVKAANNDGIWNDVPRELSITILPPPWKTWWAYLIYALLISLLLYVFYYYSYNTAKLKHELRTEHMLHEKDEELAQRKLSFFTHISHEIKTPLTLITAPLEKLINMNQGNNQVQNQLLLMQRNSDRLLRLINQLLDFRKFESGNMQLQASEDDVVRFAREVLMAFEPYAAERRITLQFAANPEKIQAWFDHDKLEKILYNLLSNAMKFTRPDGKVVVSLCVEDKEDRSLVKIAVEDNGIGITAENFEQLFEQFRYNHDNKINAAGSGIGLAFTKGLVGLHHGEIDVKSTPAVGEEAGCTCFSIKLPLGKAHLTPAEITPHGLAGEQLNDDLRGVLPSGASATERAHGGEETAVDKPVMLVVEDNADVRTFIQLHFENRFTICSAADGQSGWAKVLEVIPDIVISDVMMPGMSGTVLCSKLKADQRTSHIPVILLTARTPLAYRVEGLEAGADDYIAKPFSIQILEARVNNLLELRKKLRERFSKEVHLQPSDIAITGPDEIFLEKVMRYIEENIEEPDLSVEQLGKEINMSRTTLYRKIKALTNQTSVEFIRNVRLQRAAQLLGQNTFNVNEVAYMTGFTSVDYFRKCFKEKYSFSPREYSSHTR